ncbi:hypothetical protein DEO72_LG6g1808 [Vigna unguiculata]|uniref:Uncharacterized protein n=1 Tax=Vigna unguiculata TaxID=3917 RepID=A0A4D6M9E2_VIGUN|nr:hypothetical protein DEO72_LG6g1808 [Vigna unguiculata]
MLALIVLRSVPSTLQGRTGVNPQRTKVGTKCNIPGVPRPEHVRLLQPDAPQPLTLLRPFILGGLLPVGIEPPT